MGGAQRVTSVHHPSKNTHPAMINNRDRTSRFCLAYVNPANNPSAKAKPTLPAEKNKMSSTNSKVYLSAVLGFMA